MLITIACNNDCKKDTNISLQDHNKKMVTKYRWIGAPYLSNMYYKYLAKSPVYDRLQIYKIYSIIFSHDKLTIYWSIISSTRTCNLERTLCMTGDQKMYSSIEC